MIEICEDEEMRQVKKWTSMSMLMMPYSLSVEVGQTLLSYPCDIYGFVHRRHGSKLKFNQSRKLKNDLCEIISWKHIYIVT